jgi:hypothetical protein
MKTLFLPLFLALFIPFSTAGQDFPYGAVALNDLTLKRYDKDTSASAVVLKEFGEAWIDDGDGYHLLFKRHVRIKILTKNGLDQANVEIPLYKQGSTRVERMTSLKASSYNLENNGIHEEVLKEDAIFTEDRNKYVTVKKFAIPNVREGTVIEIAYTIDSPFIFNFRGWEFQSDIPKMESEYWASIPGVYQYNITLRGFQKLAKNESKIIKNCLGTGNSSYAGGYSADCSLMQFGMKDIPAFVEEEYMTAKKNWLSAIHFELSEVKHFSGRTDKVTKEWKDAEQELQQEYRFGVQLKRGKDIGDEVAKVIAGETDELMKAKKVYEFVKEWYLWNDTYGMFSEFGIRKAFDQRKGNVGDINLSLIAALRFAGLNVEPVILSTRANGLVVELYPVLSEFNYVVAKVNIGEEWYLADASEKFYPFGLLPERCLNGKGRVIGEKKSYWIELKPGNPRKTVSVLSLALGSDGVIRGSLLTTFMGYDAINKRQEILSYESTDAYIKELNNQMDEVSITGYEMKNLPDLEKSLSRKLDIEITAFDGLNTSRFLFNPFILDRWSENPFKSRERLYPVDFGVPLERTMILNLEYPADYEIVNLPERVGLSLPQSGGRFLFEVQQTGNKLSLNNTLALRKTLYNSAEYHYLKELFSHIVQIQNGDLIFRKKA